MSDGHKIEEVTLSRETGWKGNFKISRGYADKRLEIVESQSSDYVLESATNPTVTSYEEHVNDLIGLPEAWSKYTPAVQGEDKATLAIEGANVVIGKSTDKYEGQYGMQHDYFVWSRYPLSDDEQAKIIASASASNELGIPDITKGKKTFVAGGEASVGEDDTGVHILHYGLYTEFEYKAPGKWQVVGYGEYKPSFNGKAIKHNITPASLTNTVLPISIKVEKVWNNNGNNEAKISDSVTVNLIADGKPAGSLKLNADKEWKDSFDNLQKFNEKGDLIEYKVEEVPVKGYKPEIAGSAENGYIITNIYTLESDVPERPRREKDKPAPKHEDPQNPDKQNPAPQEDPKAPDQQNPKQEDPAPKIEEKKPEAQNSAPKAEPQSPALKADTQKAANKQDAPKTGNENRIPALTFAFAAAGVCALALKVKKEKQ